jgi:hypothetical protein
MVFRANSGILRAILGRNRVHCDGSSKCSKPFHAAQRLSHRSRSMTWVCESWVFGA